MAVGEACEAPARAASLTVDGLFRAHVNDVVRIVSRLLGPTASNADVDDLTQQVFIQVHRSLPRFRGDSAVTTWIYGIASRVVLQHLRGRRRYRSMIDRCESSQVFDHSPRGVHETVEQRQALRRVWKVLLRIKPERRVVFVLHEIEGLTAREIGEALDIKEEAVRSRLRRARADLEARLEKDKEKQR